MVWSQPIIPWLPRLVWAVGLSNADVRRAMAEVAAERERLWEAWMRIHGRNGQ